MKKNKRRFWLLLILLLGWGRSSPAQDINDSFFKKYLAQNIYSIDSDAAAIVLYEKQTTDITGGAWNGYQQRSRIYRVIKILKDVAVNIANQSTPAIPSFEHISDLTGATYTLDNGQLKKTDLSLNSVYDKSVGDGWYRKAFALPNVKTGDIIEFGYTIKAPLLQAMLPWLVQGDFPKLRSEYAIRILPTLNYRLYMQGGLSFEELKKLHDIDTATTGYHLVQLAADGRRYEQIWGKKNIPSVTDEPYVNCLSSYAQRMDVQLSDYNTYTDREHLSRNWDMVNDELWDDRYFGEKVKKLNRAFNDAMDNLVRRRDTKLQKAKKIYNYVRSNFECKSWNTIYSITDFVDLEKNKSGSVGDINLLLTAMLRNADLNASPVVLSKLGTYECYENFPDKYRLNYVICRLKIDSTYYYLDATKKYNAFGMLPMYCYNGYARLVDWKGEGVKLEQEDLKEKNAYVVNVSCLGDSILKMDVSEKLGRYESAGKRNEWANDTSLIRKDINEEAQKFGDVRQVSDVRLVNKDDPDTNLVIQYSVTINNPEQGDMWYFNTDPIKCFSSNPFKSTERKLPVEFHSRLENLYVLNLKVPDEYTIVDMPKPNELSFDNDNLLFRHYISYDSTLKLLSVNTAFEVNHTVFQPEGYSVLRKFFAQVIEDENEAITLKRRKNDK